MASTRQSPEPVAAEAVAGKPRSLHSLDWLNFFLADVQTGIGPFLAIYLTATRHWNPAQVGTVVGAQGIATIAAQSPAGALIDASRKKRWLLASGAIAVALGSVATVQLKSVGSEIFAQVLIGFAGAIFPIAIAAISLGMVGKKNLTGVWDVMNPSTTAETLHLR